MSKLLLGAVALLTVAAAPPARADESVAASDAVSWTGLYVGVGIGRKWSDSEWTTTCFGAACTTGGVNPFVADSSSPRTFSTTGTRKAVFAGFNWQLEHFLVGAEGDLGFGDSIRITPGIPGCTIFCGGLTPTPDDIDSASIETLRDGSIRGRAGFLLVPSVLAYGTAGVVFQRVEANLTCSFAGPWCFPPVATDVRNETHATTLRGWTAGAGVEWLAHGHWLIRGEYRYSDLGNLSPTFYEGTQDAVFANIEVVTQVLTVGVGYKF
jgi:outer membrane immunogenic protein